MKIQVRRISRFHVRVSIAIGDLTLTIDYY